MQIVKSILEAKPRIGKVWVSAIKYRRLTENLGAAQKSRRESGSAAPCVALSVIQIENYSRIH